MRIVFADIELAGFTEAAAKGVQCNGAIVYEAIDIVRAAQKALFARGNQLLTLSFAVRREFDSIKECETFLLTHFSLLPKTGVCTVQCGTVGSDITEVTLAGAILTASPQGSYTGRSAEVSYTIVFAAASTDDPPGIVIGGEDVIARGTEAIEIGADSVAVVFPTAFSEVPIVTVAVRKPGGGDNLFATVRADGLSETGFTADLSAPAPDTDYALNWFAVA